MHKRSYFFIVLALIFLAQSCEKEKKKSGLPMDGDGNTYDTVVLGTQVWLTENLKTTKYNRGTSIPTAEENESWTSSGRGTYCWYQNNSGYKNTYGAIYNWYAAQLYEDICPIGYHVPTEEEWKTLSDYMKNSTDEIKASFKPINVGWRVWNGTFPDYLTGDLWIHSLDGSDACIRLYDYSISHMPKNSGFPIRCVKNK